MPSHELICLLAISTCTSNEEAGSAEGDFFQCLLHLSGLVMNAGPWEVMLAPHAFPVCMGLSS